jgi:nucleoside-diphosphate-sugar epimerase
MILVTGSTGLIGSEVLRLLSHAGMPARALVRKSGSGHTLPGITWAVGDLAKPNHTMLDTMFRRVFRDAPDEDGFPIARAANVAQRFRSWLIRLNSNRRTKIQIRGT